MRTRELIGIVVVGSTLWTGCAGDDGGGDDGGAEGSSTGSGADGGSTGSSGSGAEAGEGTTTGGEGTGTHGGHEDTGGEIFPSIRVVSPMHASEVEADADGLLPVEFEVSGFTLMAPGACAGADACGHVHLLVDGEACNAEDAPYNAAGAASPMEADLSLCAAVIGEHDLRVELHADDHAPVLLGGEIVYDQVTVDVTAGGGPAIRIVSPTADATVTLEPDATFSVDYAVTGFTLMGPGTCAGAEACGHVHLLVDGEACNAPDAPYNAAGAEGPIDANLALCAAPFGEHELTVELHADDHSPVLDGDGDVIADQITVTAASEGPAIVITEPTDGTAVTLGDGPDFALSVDYAVAAFTLMGPGTCAGAADCGHVHLLIDGEACNAMDSPYNAAGAEGPIEATFGLCETPTGAHTLTVELHNDDHSPVLRDGEVVAHAVDVTAG